MSRLPGVACAPAQRSGRLWPTPVVLWSPYSGTEHCSYGVNGLWTVVQLNLPITFLVLRNGG